MLWPSCGRSQHLGPIFVFAKYLFLPVRLRLSEEGWQSHFPRPQAGPRLAPAKSAQAKRGSLWPFQAKYRAFLGPVSHSRSRRLQDPRCSSALLPNVWQGRECDWGINKSRGGTSRPFRGARVMVFFLRKSVAKSAIRHKGAWSHANGDAAAVFGT